MCKVMMESHYTKTKRNNSPKDMVVLKFSESPDTPPRAKHFLIIFFPIKYIITIFDFVIFHKLFTCALLVINLNWQRNNMKSSFQLRAFGAEK